MDMIYEIRRCHLVQKIGNPIISTYLQGLLLTGARRNELAALRWCDVDFAWKSLTIRDKVEQAGIEFVPAQAGLRVIKSQ